MALVLVFLPEPARGVAEMARVLVPGGLACAYNWDLHGRGSPLAPLGLAMRSQSHRKREEIKARFRENLQQDTSGPVTCTARAIAVQGVKR